MRFFVLIALVVLTLPATVAGPISAQPVGNAPVTMTETPTEGASDNQPENATETTRIDFTTTLVNSEYEPDQGVARITIHSERTQSITFTDSGAFVEGGEVNERTVAFRAGETDTVELSVTESGGLVGVGISTDHTLWAEVINAQQTSESPWEQTGPVAGWIGGASVVGVMGVVAAWRTKRNDPTEPEMME